MVRKGKGVAEECLRGVHAAEIENNELRKSLSPTTRTTTFGELLLNAISDWLNGWERDCAGRTDSTS